MLHDDGIATRLMAEPRRVQGALRLFTTAATVLGVIGGLCLVNVSLAVLLPGLLVALGLTTARTVGEAFWLWPGFLFCGLLFTGLAVWFGIGARKVRRLSRAGYLLGLDPQGLSAPELGLVPWPAISAVDVDWRPLRSTPAASPGGRIGQRVGRRLTTGAGQDRMIRQLTIGLRDGTVLRTSAAAMADDADFGAFLDALGARSAAYGIPLRVHRG